ncbi:sulfatase family protein [Paenibacillus glycinis]|uniref:Sulfatase-like hydrolase/transferase n=1 Tax=Paenibacillus glycinis TaxID=2697035 RepID=A0ABW9XPJ2_9BACL|nr:sulfatase [Paenibacillus glycinis]NBD24549.1 sulfatase-like hydrolase/transferase [Paenibacillus glycinis]
MERTKHRPGPNLVYVFADQLRLSACGYAGDGRAHTPNIDRLAGESMSFDNAISGHPVCAPYRASLFTGKYTTSTGMVINEIRMNPNHRCFGHVLHENGYDTAYIGKWHLWASELGNHYEPRNSYVPPGTHRLGFDGFWASYNFHHEYYGMYYHADSPAKIPMDGYEPDGQTDMAIERMTRMAGGDQPFALFLSYGTPHDPWEPENVPAAYLDMFKDAAFALPPNYSDANDPHADDWAKLSPEERARIPDWLRVYYAMTANLDWNAGRLLAAVDELGLRDDTLFVFTSDHGELFGAHGRKGKNIFYEEAVRVPFLVRQPARIPQGAATDVCLNTCDIMPTVLSLLDLPVPDEAEDMDLSPFALGEDGEEPEAAFLQGTGATADWADGHEWRALRDKRYTYAIYRDDRQELLFDHEADPHQLRDLAGDPRYGAELDRFRELLARRMSRIGDTFERCTWYRDHWTEDRRIVRTATLSAR